jgi:tetratricopeptide (TPR) repeat protein
MQWGSSAGNTELTWLRLCLTPPPLQRDVAQRGAKSRPGSGADAAPIRGQAKQAPAAGRDDAARWAAGDQLLGRERAAAEGLDLLSGGPMRLPGDANAASGRRAPLIREAGGPAAAAAAAEAEGGEGEEAALPELQHASKHTRELLKKQRKAPSAERARLAEDARLRGNEAFRWASMAAGNACFLACMCARMRVHARCMRRSRDTACCVRCLVHGGCVAPITPFEPLATARAGDVYEALDAYTLAVGLNAGDARMFANRAAVFVRLRRWAEALADADAALAIDAGHAKALLRRAEALRHLGRRGECMQVGVVQPCCTDLPHAWRCVRHACPYSPLLGCACLMPCALLTAGAGRA